MHNHTELIQCPDLDGTIENGEVTIDPMDRGVNSKATYTCGGDYQLQNGDRERNCLMDGTWDGTAPKCSMFLLLIRFCCSTICNTPC